MPLGASLAVDHLNQLNPNSNKTTVFKPREVRHRKTTGALEAARRMQSNSQSAWMRTKGICRSADGICSSWYVIARLFFVRILITLLVTEGLPICRCGVLNVQKEPSCTVATYRMMLKQQNKLYIRPGKERDNTTLLQQTFLIFELPS